MFKDNYGISNNGNNNQISGGDINNIFVEEQKKDAAITKLLEYLSEIIPEDLDYQKPDTEKYEIEDKIDFNNITIYKNDLDEYMHFYYKIDDRIKIYNGTEPTFLIRIIKYIRSVYRRCNPTNKDENTVISEMENKINDELIIHARIKNLDVLSYIDYIIFYIFAKCKIFKKPIKNYAT